MSAGWVAGSVRARLLLGRCAGPAVTAEIANASSFEEGLASLSGTLYATATTAKTLEEAQREVAACAALSLRVLSAWLPRSMATGLRAIGAWFEIANIEDRLAYFAGAGEVPPFELGVLSSVWDAAAATQSPEGLRSVLAGSSWGDPGSDDPQQIHRQLRFAWAKRVAVHAPEARSWAAGAAAILLAEEVLIAGSRVDSVLARWAELGVAWPGAETVPELYARLPRHAAWALAGIEEPVDLWRAELAWWRTVAAEAESMVRSHREGREVIVGAIALLGRDAVRVSTALAATGQGGGDTALEVFAALS